VTDPSLERAARLAGQATRRLQQRAQQVYEGSSIAGFRASESVNKVLSGIFDEPFDVPDAATAQRMILSDVAPQASTTARFLEQQASTRLTPWIARSMQAAKAARSGAATGGATSRWAVTAANAVVASATKARKASADGWNQLRVLASYLAGRARAAGLDLEEGLVRAVTVSIYLDPRKPVDLGYRGSRAGTAISARWVRDAAMSPSEAARRDLVEARVAAIERLDLDQLLIDWSTRDATP
jgi:hypothetical protein